MAPSGLLFKVKLSSGRVLGPLDLDRIRLLIQKNQIVGKEIAREHPAGEWRDINLFPEIGALLVDKARGALTQQINQRIPVGGKEQDPRLAPTRPMDVLPGATATIALNPNPLPTNPEEERDSKPPSPIHHVDIEIGSKVKTLPVDDRTSPELQLSKIYSKQVSPSGEPPSFHPTMSKVINPHDQPEEEEPEENKEIEEPSKTKEQEVTGNSFNSEPTMVGELIPGGSSLPEKNEETGFEQFELMDFNAKRISQERTVVFQRSSNSDQVPGKNRMGVFQILKVVFIAAGLGYFGYDTFLAEPEIPHFVKFVPIRPTTPNYLPGKPNPILSGKLYGQGLALYIQDNVFGYRDAATTFLKSLAVDAGNFKASAMLASSYLNLIDSSNKDENYFTVINSLIEKSRAGNGDIPEVVIAEIEFFVMSNKPSAALARLQDYVKLHPKIDVVMHYYFALAQFQRGKTELAAEHLLQIPDRDVFSPKVYYLRGLVYEKSNQIDEALNEYEKAIRMRTDHVKSRLRIADILNHRGKLKDAASNLEFIMLHQKLLSPKDMALAYYLHALLSELYQKLDIALGDIERAVRLDGTNHDYMLELYTLRGKAGESIAAIRGDARMYLFLSQGEALLKEGKYEEALTQFLQARQANDRSPIPPVKIGDMFLHLHDISNAVLNYHIAADRAPNNIAVWSKYIDLLIQSYEWEEADKAMKRFRALEVPQSAIDKLAADIYERQGRHPEAQVLYKKAMSREVIDSSVYLAFAQSLLASHDVKDAPFFFALALRYDPLSVDALVGTAKCLAETEDVGIDAGISLLQDELESGSGLRAELLSAIAEFQIQKGSWEAAQKNVDQAIAADPTYAYPWKLQAQIFMNKEGVDKDALDRALAAYQSYSERNPSDPSGYMEKYKIYIKKTQFDNASEELRKIFGVYPKYPNLHYYRGMLYSLMGNHKVAVDELVDELNHNPNSVQVQVALGKELIEVGDAVTALKHFNIAMRMAPKYAEAKHQSGYANYLLKNYLGAIALYNAALKYDKANPTIYKRLGLAYLEIGDAAGAAQSFRKYLEMEPDAPDRAEFERYR